MRIMIEVDESGGKLAHQGTTEAFARQTASDEAINAGGPPPELLETPYGEGAFAAPQDGDASNGGPPPPELLAMIGEQGGLTAETQTPFAAMPQDGDAVNAGGPPPELLETTNGASWQGNSASP